MKSAKRSVCRLAGLALLSLALGACQAEKAKTGQKGTAEGEILPGSASDAMLPYDTVRSQPPLAPLPTATARAGGKANNDSADEASADSSESAAEAEPAPAAAPQAGPSAAE